jgi:hypothetical protein
MSPKGEDLQRQRQHQSHRAKGPDPTVLHDFQTSRDGLTAAQAVRRVRQSVFVKGAGQRDTRGDGERGGDPAVPDFAREQQHHGRQAAYDLTHQREIARGARDPVFLESRQRRHRNPGQELDRASQQLDLQR